MKASKGESLGHPHTQLQQWHQFSEMISQIVKLVVTPREIGWKDRNCVMHIGKMLHHIVNSIGQLEYEREVDKLKVSSK